MCDWPVSFSLCGVWMCFSLSPVWQLLRLSTELFRLLIYDFRPPLLSYVYSTHMWKLFQWLVMGNTFSASISPNQYACNNALEMSGRTLEPVKVREGWTKSKTSSSLTIPKWSFVIWPDVGVHICILVLHSKFRASLNSIVSPISKWNLA